MMLATNKDVIKFQTTKSPASTGLNVNQNQQHFSGLIIMQKKTKVNMNIDRPRLQNIALRKTQEQEPVVHICRACGQSSSFSFNFQVEKPTKTCFECGFVDVVKEEQEEAA